MSQLRVRVLGADRLRHQRHVAPWLSAPSLLVCNRKRSRCTGHVRGRGSGHRGVRMLSAGRWLGGSNPATAQNGGGTGLKHQPVQVLILEWPVSCWANLGKPHPHPDSETGCTYLAPFSSRGENPGAQRRETVEKETSTTESRASCLCAHQRCFLLCHRTDSEASLPAGLPWNPRLG